MGHHSTGGSAEEVITKGMCPANVDFAVLGVSREGKCSNTWCSAGQVCLTRI